MQMMWSAMHSGIIQVKLVNVDCISISSLFEMLMPSQ